jgi:hypothetical protein
MRRMTCASTRVARPDMAAHRHAREPERQRRRELAQHRFGARAAGVAVGDQPDAVSARDLLFGEIEHMAEQSADRSAEHVEDIQGIHRARTVCVQIESKLNGNRPFHARCGTSTPIALAG